MLFFSFHHSVRRSLLLLFLYMTLFGVPHVVLNVPAGGWFWATLGASFLFGMFVFFRGTTTLQFYYIFFVFILMFGYFIQTLAGISYKIHTFTPSSFSLSTFVFIVAHFAGMAIGASLRKRSRPNVIVRERLSPSYWLFGTATFLFLFATFVAFFGTEPLFAPRNELFGTELSGTVRALAGMLKAFPFVFMAILFGRLRDGRFRRRDAVALVVTFIAAIAFSNPITTPRYISLGGILLVIAAWLGQTSKSRHLLVLTVLSAYVSVFLLPITSTLRTGLDQFDFAKVISMYSGLEFSSIHVLMDGINAGSQLPSGNVLITDFFSLVPPAIFPGSLRAAPVGPSIAESSGYVFSNAAVPSFFSAYLDGGAIGLIIFSILMGYVMQAASVAERSDMRNRRDGYALILFACIPILARGDLRTAVVAFYDFAIAYEIFLFVVRLRFGKRANVASRRFL